MLPSQLRGELKDLTLKKVVSNIILVYLTFIGCQRQKKGHSDLKIEGRLLSQDFNLYRLV